MEIQQRLTFLMKFVYDCTCILADKIWSQNNRAIIFCSVRSVEIQVLLIVAQECL